MSIIDQIQSILTMNIPFYVLLADTAAFSIAVAVLVKKPKKQKQIAPQPQELTQGEEALAEIMMQRAETGDEKAIKWLSEHGYSQS